MGNIKLEEKPAEISVAVSTTDTKVFRPKKRVYLFFKRLIDIIASACSLLLLSPVFLIIAILIKAEDGGPIFYSSLRVGKCGKMIRVFKFRSMRLNADQLEQMLSPSELEEYQKNFKLDRDPRITNIGAKLRKSSLDEIPQFLNILLGSMSLVGPRPVLQEETELYGEDRDLLLSVTPGLTGYWQSRGRSKVGYEDGARQQMELYYVRNCSFLLDLKILFWTISAVLRRNGAQ